MRSASQRMRSLLGRGLLAVLGIGLVLAAAPVFMSHFVAIPGNPVLTQLQALRMPDRAALELLVSTRRDALEWREDAELFSELGLAYASLARLAKEPERTRFLREARDALRRGNQLAPANAYTWMRLCRVELELGSAPDEIVALLNTAMALGPNEPRLVFPALDAGLRMWDHLNAVERGRIRRLFGYGWRLAPGKLAEVLAQHEHAALIATETLTAGTSVADEQLFGPLASGLRLWPHLGEADRKAVVELLQRGWLLKPLLSVELVEHHRRAELLQDASILNEQVDDERLFEALEGTARLWRRLGQRDRETAAVIFSRAWAADPQRTADIAGNHGLIDALGAALGVKSTARKALK